MRILSIAGLILTCFSWMSPASAQSDPQVHVLNPTGFVRPGDWFEVYAELVNPADSGQVIDRVSGGGRSGASFLSRSAFSRSTFDPDQQTEIREARMQRARSNPGGRHRAVSGSFPVYPGESVVFVLMEEFMPGSAQPGQDRGFQRLSVKLDTGSQDALPTTVYADLNVIRIASENGQGEESVFAGLDLASQHAGVMQADLYAEFNHPQEIVAGESFELEATIFNEGSNSVSIMLAALGTMSGFMNWQGEHAQSYRFVSCAKACGLTGSIELAPGEFLRRQLGTFYYENDDFFSGDFILERFSLSVTDQLGRHEMRPATASPVLISVINQPNSRRLFSGNGPLPRPLQLQDLYSPGDERIVNDPNTGLDWLMLTEGEGYSVEAMLAANGPGGEFEGFRLASSREVETLYLNHMNASGVKLGDYAVYELVTEVEALQNLVGLLGNIPTVNNTFGFNGIVSDDLPSRHDENALYTILELSVTASHPDRVMMFSGSQGLRKQQRRLENSLSAYTGYWLVR